MEKKTGTETLAMDLELNGLWDFTYRSNPGGDDHALLPVPVVFPAKMPVPAYWDDHLARLQDAPFWSNARFNPDHRPLAYPLGDNPPDASTPFLFGIGWYHRQVVLPSAPRSFILRMGGVKLEAWIWLNGKLVKHHLGHSTSFEADLTPCVMKGQSNDLCIAVSNLRRDRVGTVIRGWAGYSAGITGPVTLHMTEEARITSAYAYPSDGLDRLFWQVGLAALTDSLDYQLVWRMVDPATGQKVSSGTQNVTGLLTCWESDTGNLSPWSDVNPTLYRLEVSLVRSGSAVDAVRQGFGLRRLRRDGNQLSLNGRPVFLRGATEHAYYPETCTPPMDKSYYRNAIAKLKAVGFNWLRFHTSVPNELYMEAADELGMMIQTEAPEGFTEPEWVDILHACRTHPSVVIYCCGNEECLDDDKIESLARMAACQKESVPDALFNPQEALRGVEYGWKQTDLGDRVVREPYPHTPHRLARLKEFSDCFGQYAWGHLSYDCSHGNLALLHERLADYEKPLLSHEMGIIGNYLNLDLEHRYEGTRIGCDMFESLRHNLEKAGLLHRAAQYYRNSCAWARVVRKHNIETARRCRYVNGYDYLGGIDCHWHRFGYPCGVLNEFYELKPDESAADILAYNGESVLLCDHEGSRNITGGQPLSCPISACLYGQSALTEGRMTWTLRSLQGECLAAGELRVGSMELGGPLLVASITATVPDVDHPLALVLSVRLVGGCYDLANEWRFWAFPATVPAQGESVSIHISESLDAPALDLLEAGESLILLGPGPLPALPTTFQPACAGRAKGNLATVIFDHPLLNSLPHDGFCDWQFKPLLDGGCAVVFDELAAPFDPLLEVVSSFKSIHKQGALFEYRVGRGRLLVCTLNLKSADPVARWLRSQIVKYAASPEFNPSQNLAASVIRTRLTQAVQHLETVGTDMAFDARAQRRKAKSSTES